MQFFSYPPVRFVIGIFSLVLSVGLARSIVGHFTRGDVVEIRRQGLIKEETRNKELKMALTEATSAAFVERLAREKLGLAKEGDTIILLDTSKKSNTKDQQNQESIKSNWEKWWGLFF